ncbi:hypothetical protein FORC48_2235 [Bacillus cereus]|nr:hypothetical protein FORC48_2235 [Bacillus cereus]
MSKGKKQVSQLSFLVNFMNDKGSLVKI